MTLPCSPTTPLDTHTWQLHTLLPLGLPLGATQDVPVFVVWRCLACDTRSCSTGTLPLTQPIPGPVAWQARANAESEDEGEYAAWRTLERRRERRQMRLITG